MSHFWRDVEPIVLKGRIKVPYSWQAGETASFFLSELRDSKKIWGKRCPGCEKVLVPPRKSCPFCFVDTEQWVEVSTEGTVATFTIVKRDTPVQPVKSPFAYALIYLDGADTGLIHLLGEVKPEAIREGMKVEAVFAQTRQGSLLDIVHFRPSGHEGRG